MGQLWFFFFWQNDTSGVCVFVYSLDTVRRWIKTSFSKEKKCRDDGALLAPEWGGATFL